MYFNKKIQCTIVVWLLKVWHISVPGFSLLLDTEDLVEGLSIFQTDYPGLSKLQTDYPRLLKLLTNYQGLSKFLKDNQAPSGFKTDCQWPFGLKAECQRLYEVPDKIKGLFRILEKLFADIDNCASLSPSCTSNQGLCKYKEGTNFCSCESGWKVSEDNGSCVDINECFNLKKPCPGNTFCENTIGSYSCTCGSGLILGKDKASCVDIDECKAFSCPCSNDEECVNLPGGYSCNCKNGFRKEQNICVARCNKTCDIATSKCILADGLESCQCNAGYSKIYTNNDDILCVPNCSQICDAVKAQCIVEHGVALCKCKVEYGIGSGLASDGNNSCSHYIIGNKPTVIQKGNFIALIPELPREYLVSFDIYPNAFTSGWHNVVLFTDDSNTIKSNNGVLGIWFHVNGNGELYISPHLYGNSNGFVSKSLGLNMWSSIEISQVLNGSVYDYTVKINKKIVFSQTKQSVQSFKFVRVFASSSSNNAQDGLIKNFYFITNNQNTNYNPIVIPLKDSSFDNIWTNYNQLMYLKIDKNARQIKPIYGDLDKHKEAQGFWFSLPSKIVVVIDNLHKNVNMVLSAVGYAVKGCILLIRFDKYKKEPIKLKSGVFYDFKLHYGINDLDFARFNLNIESSDCNFTKVYLFSANIAFEDINECTSLVPPCSWSNGVCENTYGSYLCKCANGWKIEGKSCLDIDECTAATFPCPLNNGMCENTMGSYICKCESGWMLNGNICIDNELYLVVILPKGLNLKNAWIPDDGLYWSRFQNINEKFIEKVAILDYNVLGFWATKNERLEVFIDPLWINLASISFNFRLSIISYALRPSNLSVNYIMDADQTIFYSKNIELINNSFVTSEIVLTFDQYKEIILFDIGFYRVNNNPIYLISVNASLEDINECNDTSPCPWTSSECENTFGSYLCKCKIGFLINKENDSCFDINECNDTSRCPWTNSECENTFGSYLCKCKIGFLISKENDSCVDINECNDTSPCPWTSSECENTFGSYLCKCKIGFLINKENDSCFDINECNDTSRCPWTNSECENTFGSYLCKCKIGFLISKENDSCVDINECHNKTQCPWTNAVCLNTYGSYLCKCENGWKLGEDNASCIDRTHSVSASVFKVDVSILVPVLLILIILVVVIVLWIQKRKEFQPVWLNQDPNALDIYLDYQKLKTDEWEILPSNIIFGKKIGEGAFGNVFIAKITAKTFAKTNHLNQLFDDLCDIKEDSTINVAVKLLKDGASDLEYNDFVKEITLMKGIGYHKNIVNMIGCCTFGKYLCLVNEFMENGDLLHFLRNTRIKFISLNDDIEAQVRFIYTHTNPLLLEKTKLMQNEIALMDMEPIKSSDLLSFAWQIASGMEYLSCIKLVHRDLAARNILVGAKKNLKISDFGLTCKLNDEANYTGKTNRRLPIKWMSVEAIFYRLFTTFSDVWSYGVVLFEIVTLGGTPYSTISNGELLPLLKSGYRMERPDNCSQTVYDIMLRCWNQDPLMRPTFTELRELFEKIMSHGDRYVSLDIDKESAYYNTNSSSSSDKIDESKQEEVLLVVKPVEEFKNIDSHVYSIDDEQHKICFSYMLTRTTEQPKKIVIKNLNDLVLELRN
ncbi:uncharacterized protein LOC136082347 isoform X4 [Hydra vulgaris]|uniref:Uncharacterized protein LOC136082347 isoform X4 n=1 Tax=Hydra vulgaris TaxID=6087 RepID=A0ABM4C756_HYDVU